MDAFKEFEVYATITGYNYCPGARRLMEDEKIILCPEPNNEYDKFAISVYCETGRNGYIANSEKTIRKGTLSAKRLVELIDGTARAEIVEGGYYEAICRVYDIYDMDKMILKAYKYYNEMDYANALVLFLKIYEKYDSVLLMQYISDCYIKQEKYLESLEFSRHALKAEGDNKISLMMYANALHKLGKYAEAIEPYEKILEQTENEIVKSALEECMRRCENDE